MERFRWMLVAFGSVAVVAWALAAGRPQTTAAQPPDQPGASSMNSPSNPAKPSQPAKPSEEELRARLTPLQFEVTQHEGTEPPFRNTYWDNKQPGIYVDVVTGEPLFSSLDKFDSGTGWPSFTRPLVPENVVSRTDYKLLLPRTEVRSKTGDSHLGHVFDDGPAPTGKRFCMNSAALRFVPVERLAAEGYGEFLPRFVEAGVVTAAATPGPGGSPGAPAAGAAASNEGASAGNGAKPSTETAILAGGCFWGMEEILREIPGVIDTEVGYTGGTLPEPTYQDITTGRTGHAESLRIVFDPQRLRFEDLLGWFFRMHDPTTRNRQGNDVGTQYRSAIFYTSEAQRETAERVKQRVDQSGKWPAPVVTEITAASTFWPAEDYHQDYLLKHPHGYSCHFLRD